LRVNQDKIKEEEEEEEEEVCNLSSKD